MGLPIVAGRWRTTYWPGQNPLGRHVKIWGGLSTVIGIARNSKHQFIDERPEPMVYMSFFQNPDETTVMVQTRGDESAIAPAVEDAIHQVNQQLVVFDVRALSETTRASTIFPVLASTFAGIFAVITLVLSMTGIYGVVAYQTQLRTHEIGVRIALGASRADVLRLVLMQGIQLTIAGLVAGLALAYGLTRFIASMLYGVSATDPTTAIEVMALRGFRSWHAICRRIVLCA